MMASSTQCRFYNTPGGCARGFECHYLHENPVETATKDVGASPPMQKHIQLCTFFQKSICRKGDMCRFAHTIATPDMKDKDEVKSKEWTCAICLEIPKFFGVLIGCNHPFCMPCLKRWRDKQSKEHYLRESTVIKGCPVCREPSRFIVPSAVFPETEDQKKALIEDYKDSTQKTHCRYFQKSNGIDRRCPFGDDCLFGHRDSNGNKVLNVLRPPSRQSQRISNPFSSLFGPSIHIFHGPRMVPAFRYLSEILDGLSEDEDEDSDFEDDWA